MICVFLRTRGVFFIVHQSVVQNMIAFLSVENLVEKRALSLRMYFPLRIFILNKRKESMWEKLNSLFKKRGMRIVWIKWLGMLRKFSEVVVSLDNLLCTILIIQLKCTEDSSAFVLTGTSIYEVAWLGIQLGPAHVAKRDLCQTIAGLVKRQMTLFLRIPMPALSSWGELEGPSRDQPFRLEWLDLGAQVWGGFTVLSPCNRLIFFGRGSRWDCQFDETFVTTTKEILHLWTVEQDTKTHHTVSSIDTDRKEDAQ